MIQPSESTKNQGFNSELNTNKKVECQEGTIQNKIAVSKKINNARKRIK